MAELPHNRASTIIIISRFPQSVSLGPNTSSNALSANSLNKGLSSIASSSSFSGSGWESIFFRKVWRSELERMSRMGFESAVFGLRVSSCGESGIRNRIGQGS